MDLRMKPIDGLRATASIKAHFPQTRIAIVSQYADPELRAEAARVGACAYVLKENLQELPALLARLRAGNGTCEAAEPGRGAGARNDKPE